MTIDLPDADEPSASCRVDCGDAGYLMSRMPKWSIGGIITDPPDLSRFAPDGGAGVEDDSPSVGIKWARPFASQIARVVRPGGSVVIMGNATTCAAWIGALEEAGLLWMAELTVLWNTGKARQLNFGSLTTSIQWFAARGARHTWNSDRKAVHSNVLIVNKTDPMHRHHPAQKPIELTTFLVSLLTRDKDVVLDPFCGSGSTLVSARIVGRPSIGIDKDRLNVETARRRVNNWEVEEEGKLHLWFNGRTYEV